MQSSMSFELIDEREWLTVLPIALTSPCPAPWTVNCKLGQVAIISGLFGFAAPYIAAVIRSNVHNSTITSDACPSVVDESEWNQTRPSNRLMGTSSTILCCGFPRSAKSSLRLCKSARGLATTTNASPKASRNTADEYLSLAPTGTSVAHFHTVRKSAQRGQYVLNRNMQTVLDFLRRCTLRVFWFETIAERKGGSQGDR